MAKCHYWRQRMAEEDSTMTEKYPPDWDFLNGKLR
jgi:hypothetical protein